MTGAVGHKRVPKEYLSDLLVPLPSIKEQHRIVAVLDEAFEGLARARANVEANVADADEVVGSFIESQLKTLNAPAITLQKMIDDGFILEHLDGNHGSAYPRKSEFVAEGVPYISANCITNGKIDFSRAKFLTEQRAGTIRKGVAEDGDVIFAHNATVGPTALLRTSESRVILSTSVTFYRPNSDRLDSEFLLHEMRSAAFRRQYEEVMQQSTRNQVPITMQRRFHHAIPSLGEQKKVAARCRKVNEEVDRLSAVCIEKRERLNTLSASLLSRAFAGELT